MVWFRNDLRLHDHEPFYKATLKFKDVIPVYCFDPRQFHHTCLGFPKTDYFRAKFMIEAVTDLRNSLRKLGSDLIVRIGIPEEIIPEMAKHLKISKVYCSKEITYEEINIENKLESNLWSLGIPLETFWISTLFHPSDIPFPISNVPDTFSQFRKAVESGTQVRVCYPTPLKASPLKGIPVGLIPSLSDLGLEKNQITDSRAVIDFQGGESQGLARLRAYIWDKDLLRNYKKNRNGLLGGDYSSKLSPWLALGCLSVRKVYEEITLYEKEVVKNQSTYWLVFELLWRDYFKFVAKKYGNVIFKTSGIKAQATVVEHNKDYFEKWTQGKTGVPFIDANMRELKQTGFMSNRGRQNVASFLAKDLKVNWVWGAMYFESKLIDYDVCNNWCNWAYVAGVGNDPRENRYFNILNQAKKYDKQGEYVKHWLPELSTIPHPNIHEVYQMNDGERQNAAIYLTYPSAIIPHDYWL